MKKNKNKARKNVSSANQEPWNLLIVGLFEGSKFHKIMILVLSAPSYIAHKK